jgi:hypothetical protein
MDKLIAACKALMKARDEWIETPERFPSDDMLHAFEEIEEALSAPAGVEEPGKGIQHNVNGDI